MQMHRTDILWPVVLVTLFAACFNPDEPETYYCNEAAGKTQCPSGLVCVGTVCVTGGQPDRGSDLTADMRDMAADSKPTPDSNPDSMPKPDSKPTPDSTPKPDQSLFPCTPHEPKLTGTWPNNWNKVNGSWSLASGQMYQKAVANPKQHEPYHVVYTGVYGDFTFEAEAKIQGPPVAKEYSAGLLYRYQNTSNFYFALIHTKPTTGQVLLVRVKNGVPTEYKGTASAVSGKHTITAVVKGSKHTIYLDGTQVLAVTDTTFTNGKVGLATHKAAVMFGDVAVTCP